VSAPEPLTPPAPGSLYARSADVDASTVGDRVILYNRTSRSALVLNPTGTEIWERLTGPASLADLTAALRARYPALAPEDARRDVLAFVEELTRHGALVQAP
jgi:hypothetical protein